MTDEGQKMSYENLPSNKRLKKFSQTLRKNATKEENHLWYDFLRKYPVQINRQKVIGNYIADFYCKTAKIVIELDGSGHYYEKAQQKDKKRDDFFESLGIKVLRFSNLEIQRKFKAVCEMIDTEIKERL